MLNFLPAPLLGVIAALLLALNTLFWVPILLFLAILRLLIPLKAVGQLLAPALVFTAEAWIAVFSQTAVDLGPGHGVGLVGARFPFYAPPQSEELRKHPGMRGEDQETTRKACEKFALIPTSVMNFLEGTRFTQAKHRSQRSPYPHLLKPKAGAIALALNAMGDKFRAILNVTIVYPDGVPGFWHFLCGRMRRTVVRVQVLGVPEYLINADYAGDPAVREQFHKWVHRLWLDKEAGIASILNALRGH